MRQPLTCSLSLKVFLHLVSLGNNYNQLGPTVTLLISWFRGFLINTQKLYAEKNKMAFGKILHGTGLGSLSVSITDCFSDIWWCSVVLTYLKLLLSQIRLFGEVHQSDTEDRVSGCWGTHLPICMCLGKGFSVQELTVVSQHNLQNFPQHFPSLWRSHGCLLTLMRGLTMWVF